MDVTKPTTSSSSGTDSDGLFEKVEIPSAISQQPDERQEKLEQLELDGFEKNATRRLLRKLDITLLPFLALLYLLSFLDRSNIGNAKIAHFEKDIGLKDLEFNTALAVFFPFYILAEIPSNLAMKRFRPSIWIPSLMVAWGTVCTCMGFVDNFSGLVVARCALGLAEGGLFPGVTYYITLWYRRQECGLRMALFFSAAVVAGAFGGLLARGIMEMDGVAGRPAWSWIFIIEGLLTLIVGLAAYKIMHDYPGTAKFLNEDEKKEVIRRLEEDRSVLSDDFNLKYVKDAMLDWKIYVNMFIALGTITPLYSFSFFAPTIVKGLGYASEEAQLMSVPPYVVACFFCVVTGYLADKQNMRGPYMIGCCAVAMVGYIILMATENNHARYFGCILVATGIYSTVPQGVAWNGNNIGGTVKRGVGIAMQVGFGNLGGIISGYVYREDDAPRYVSGHGILLGMTFMGLVLSVFMTTYLRRENKRRDREYKAPADYSLDEMLAEKELDDKATFFRYVV